MKKSLFISALVAFVMMFCVNVNAQEKATACTAFKVPLVRIAPIPLLHNIWSRYCGIRLLDAHNIIL